MFTLLAQIAETTEPEITTEAVETITTITDFAAAFGTWQMKIIAIILAIDVILGIAAAIASKKFNFNKLATFMATGVLPYLFGFAVIEMVADGFAVFGEIAKTAIFLTLILNLLGSIISNLATLGLNMPSIFKKEA